MDRRTFLANCSAICLRPILDFDKRVALLTRYVPALEPQFQGRTPDCVARAAAVAVEILNAIEHVLFDAPEPRKVRVAYLHKQISKPGMGGGAPVEDVIPVLKRGFPWGEFGERARIKTAHQITSFAEAANAIKSLQPIIVSSNVSFKGATLDGEGFIKPTGKKWGHAWCMIGVDDRYKRPGALLISSWGKTWPDMDAGSRRRHAQPDGSAWVDARTIDTMLGTYGNSYAISDMIRVQGTRTITFYSGQNCAPCTLYKPIIAQFPEIVTAASGHNVSPVPQVWIEENGQTRKLVGLKTKEQLSEFLR